jgi:hypothetical protein
MAAGGPVLGNCMLYLSRIKEPGVRSMMNPTQALTPIKAGRPFFGMVNTFMASAVGLGPFFDPVHPQKPTPASAAAFYGFFNPMSARDMHRTVSETLGQGMTAAEALNTLCCMLVITAFKVVKGQVDTSPEMEVFGHLKNAAAHGNRFSFRSDMPKLPASWRTFRIDETKKGNFTPLHGKPCFGTIFGPADLLLLLSDIDKKLA